MDLCRRSILLIDCSVSEFVRKNLGLARPKGEEAWTDLDTLLVPFVAGNRSTKVGVDVDLDLAE